MNGPRSRSRGSTVGGSAQSLIVETATTRTRRAYIRFDLSSLAGRTIDQAVLQLTTGDATWGASQGTFAIARAVAEANAFSIVGGGDSAAAVAQSGVESRITHISTGGGASLEFLSGQKLPGVEVLTDRS